MVIQERIKADLKKRFINNSNCYAAQDWVDGVEVSVTPAMTEDIFVKVVSELLTEYKGKYPS